MSLDKKSLLKKRQRKELKRNKKRKYLRAETLGGRIKPMTEHQRYIKALFNKAVREGKIKIGPDGKLVAPSLSTPTAITVETDRETSTDKTEVEKKPLPAKATTSEDDTVRV